MTTSTQLKGQWQQAKGRVKEAWGDLTDDEVDQTEGNWDQLVGKIREKTGETTEQIESKMNDIMDSISDSDGDTTG
ncbi:MAG: CsbD family protein [Acidimicrobiia bacterium]